MRERIANVSSDEKCARCADTPGRNGPSGMVVVSRRVADGRTIDDYGPCPDCEAGARFEARRWPDGYWRGREQETFPPQSEGRMLSRRENALRMRILNRRMAGDETADPLVGIDLRDPAKRITILERAVAAR